MIGQTLNRHLNEAMICINAFYDRVFRSWPGAVTRRWQDCTLSYSGDARLTGANHLWPHSPEALTGHALDEANRFFTPLRAAWSVVYVDTYVPHATDFLYERHYAIRWTSPVMVLDRPPSPRPAHPTAEVLRAESAKHITDIRLIMSEAFATDLSVNRRVAREGHILSDDVLHYITYIGGEPAGCATVARSGPMAGIWNVGTRYKFRRQGIASAIMVTLLDDLRRDGCPRTMLMASPAGQPLYHQLGYRTIGTAYYMRPPFVDPRRYR